MADPSVWSPLVALGVKVRNEWVIADVASVYMKTHELN